MTRWSWRVGGWKGRSNHGFLAMPQLAFKQCLHVGLGQVKLRLLGRFVGQTLIELGQGRGDGQQDFLAHLPVKGQRHVVLVHVLQGLKGRAAAHRECGSRSWRNTARGKLCGWGREKYGPHGRRVALAGLEHAVEARHLPINVGDDGKAEIHPALFAHIVDPGNVRVDTVNAQAQ